MKKRNLVRSDLVEEIHGSVGISRADSASIVESIFELMSLSLIKDETVKIPYFGSLITRYKNRRVGRNLRTGEEVEIVPRKVVTFKPSNKLKDRLNQS